MMNKRKLEKKVRKLAKWAMENGCDYLNVSVMAPDHECDRWYANSSFRDGFGNTCYVSGFIGKREVEQ